MEGYIQYGFFISSEYRKITKGPEGIRGISILAHSIVAPAGVVKFHTLLAGAISMTVEVE